MRGNQTLVGQWQLKCAHVPPLWPAPFDVRRISLMKHQVLRVNQRKHNTTANVIMRHSRQMLACSAGDVGLSHYISQ